MNSLLSLIILVPLLPLLASLWIMLSQLLGWSTGESGERITARVTTTATALALVLLLLIDLEALLYELPTHTVIAHWLESDWLQITISFTTDPLGLTLATLVAVIALLTQRFSINYLHREAGYHRFFMILALFTSAMLLIILAGNLGLLFVGWELAGISSYLLIGYNLQRDSATRNATYAVITNRLGDTALLAAIFFSALWLGSLEWPQMFAAIDTVNGLQLGLIGAAGVLAALVKSAQFPFSSWIGKALEGPTPSSAIFYGSLMIHAGVYLVLRLQPVIESSPPLMLLLVVVGVVTVLYGYLVGLVQTDIKSALIFSTLSQVGLMFLVCGLGGFQWVAIYLPLHAAWRSWQFLHAPSLMHWMVSPTRPVPRWLQPLQRLYTAALNRFWLDAITQWLLVRPTHQLSREIHAFDSRVLRPIVGTSSELHVISSLAEWEKHSCQIQSSRQEVAEGSGLFGVLLQQLANLFVWIEEHLILKGGGEGIIDAIQRSERLITRIETLLSQPRYLLLMIMATFVLIL